MYHDGEEKPITTGKGENLLHILAGRNLSWRRGFSIWTPNNNNDNGKSKASSCPSLQLIIYSYISYIAFEIPTHPISPPPTYLILA